MNPDIRIERGQPPPAAPGPPACRIRGANAACHRRDQILRGRADRRRGLPAGTELDLAGLRAMAARITAFYNRHGYFVAQAYLPAQDVQTAR